MGRDGAPARTAIRATERTRTSANKLRSLVSHPWSGGVLTRCETRELRTKSGARMLVRVRDPAELQSDNRAPAAREELRLTCVPATGLVARVRDVPPRGLEPQPTSFAALCPFLGTVAKRTDGRTRTDDPWINDNHLASARNRARELLDGASALPLSYVCSRVAVEGFEPCVRSRLTNGPGRG